MGVRRLKFEGGSSGFKVQCSRLGGMEKGAENGEGRMEREGRREFEGEVVDLRNLRDLREKREEDLWRMMYISMCKNGY